MIVRLLAALSLIAASCTIRSEIEDFNFPQSEQAEAAGWPSLIDKAEFKGATRLSDERMAEIEQDASRLQGRAERLAARTRASQGSVLTSAERARLQAAARRHARRAG
jgi:hypothetical protein